jgi:EAL and modified HD-GYP domain-containing signal transduction protein
MAKEAGKAGGGTKCYIPTFFARQPVFDIRQQVWGYELLFRDSEDAESAEMTDMHQATLDVAADAFAGPDPLWTEQEKILVNFSHKNILENIPYALPPSRTVIKVSKGDNTPQKAETALKQLKQDGFLVALDCDWSSLGDSTWGRRFSSIADIVIVDALHTGGKRLEDLLGQIPPGRVHVLAKRVEDQETFIRAKEAGCTLFQGFFFKKPEVVRNRRLTSHEYSRFHLLRLIEIEDPDFKELAGHIERDVTISYRLLAYINSASIGVPTKIGSIQQATALLGWKQLRNWLRVLILTDLQSKGKTKELSFLSAQRGKFLELTASAHEVERDDSSNLFLLGLLSLLEAMLDMPMREIMEHLPLDDEITRALSGEGGKYSPWLNLVRCFEAGSWEELDEVALMMNLDPVALAGAYYDATIWANSFQRAAGSNTPKQ